MEQVLIISALLAMLIFLCLKVFREPSQGYMRVRRSNKPRDRGETSINAKVSETPRRPTARDMTLLDRQILRAERRGISAEATSYFIQSWEAVGRDAMPKLREALDSIELGGAWNDVYQKALPKGADGKRVLWSEASNLSNESIPKKEVLGHRQTLFRDSQTADNVSDIEQLRKRADTISMPRDAQDRFIAAGVRNGLSEEEALRRAIEELVKDRERAGR